jgi:hypothetical protein
VVSYWFKIFLQHDGTCFLNVNNGQKTSGFADVLEAITAAREMSGGRKSPLTVYDTLGALVFETLV